MGRRTLYGCNKGAFLVIVRTSTGVFQGRNKEEKDTKVAEDRESREMRAVCMVTDWKRYFRW